MILSHLPQLNYDYSKQKSSEVPKVEIFNKKYLVRDSVIAC